MINKVAVSQCVRDAFPKDYEGLYSSDEMVASGAIDADYNVVDTGTGNVIVEDPVITQEQRQALFRTAQNYFGKEDGNAIVKSIIEEEGLNSTTDMTESQYEKAMHSLMETIRERIEAQDYDS